MINPNKAQGDLTRDIDILFSSVDALENKAIFNQVNVKDFGAVGDGVTDDTEAVQSALDSGSNVVIDGDFLITDYLYLNTDYQSIKFISGSKITQSTWAYPAFYINADNVTIENPYMINSGTKTIITGTIEDNFIGKNAAGEGALNAYNFCAGIFSSMSINEKGSNLYVKNWYAENFAVGIFLRGSANNYNKFSKLESGKVSNVDWGVVATIFENLTIDGLAGTNINRDATDQPCHLVYITGGSSIIRSNGLIMNNLQANDVKESDHAFSIKYTDNVNIGSWVVTNSSQAWNFQYANGVVGTGVIECDNGQTSAVILTQTEADITFVNPHIKGNFIDRCIAATTDSKMKIINPIVEHTGVVKIRLLFFIVHCLK